MHDLLNNPIVNTAHTILIFLLIIACWIKVVQLWVVNLKSKDEDQVKNWYLYCLAFTLIVALITYVIWPLD